MGLGSAVNHGAYFSPGTLTAIASEAGQQVTTTTFVSNRGGVEDGADLTDDRQRTHALAARAGDGARRGRPDPEA